LVVRNSYVEGRLETSTLVMVRSSPGVLGGLPPECRGVTQTDMFDRHEEDLALLRTVDALAAETAKRISCGAHEDEAEVLRFAYVQAGGTDKRVLRIQSETRPIFFSVGSSPSSAMVGAKTDWTEGLASGMRPVLHVALASVCLLLCTATARIGLHHEALDVAKVANEECKKAWEALLAGTKSNHARPAQTSSVQGARLKSLLQNSSSEVVWLGQLAETSVQAKHVLALELELTEGSAAEAERFHLEGNLLAQHLLAAGHPVRLRAELAVAEWSDRISASKVSRVLVHCDDIDSVELDGRHGPPTSCVPIGVTATDLLRMLLGPSWQPPAEIARGTVPGSVVGQDDIQNDIDRAFEEGVLDQFSPFTSSEPGIERMAPWSKAQRLYLGLRAPIDMNQECRRFHRQTLKGRVASTGSMLGNERSVAWDPLCSSRLGSTWSNRSAAPGELYHGSLDWGPAGLPKGRNWNARGRSPIFFDMSGSPGKTSWALRSGVPRQEGKCKKTNVFQDWLEGAGGDAKPLKAKVLESIAGQEYFYASLRTESRKFKNAWFNEEVDADALADDRILFCAEGMALKRRMRNEATRAARDSARSAVGPKDASATDVGPEDVAPFVGAGSSCLAVGVQHSDPATAAAVAAAPASPGGSRPGTVSGLQRAMTLGSRGGVSINGSGLAVSTTSTKLGVARVADRKARSGALFQEYGLKCSTSEPKLADFRKLLAASQSRLIECVGSEAPWETHAK